MKAITTALFVCGLAACMAEAPPPAPTAEPADPTAQPADGLVDDALTSRPATSAVTEDELAGAPSDPDLAAAQNCVFIQWCDQPSSPSGTVCIVRNTAACQSQCVNGISTAIFNECEGDYNAVCGGFVRPVRIFCSTSHE
jgi:hypothetical protein